MTARLLVLGTRNRKKGAELRDLLAPQGFDVRTLEAFPAAVEVEEDGPTFAENARKKAREQALALGRWVVGEDSGLEVEALGGRPGVFSARYAGPGADDAANNRLLLEELGETPPQRRGARYVCTLAVADPHGNIRAESEGFCRGMIRFAESGDAGFGYDPLFVIPEYHRTFGELGVRVKHALSHRSRAIRSLLPRLDALRAVWGE